MPSKISDDIVDRVKGLIAEKQSLRVPQLYPIYGQRYGYELSKRKFYDIYNATKKDAPAAQPVGAWQAKQARTNPARRTTAERETKTARLVWQAYFPLKMHLFW